MILGIFGSYARGEHKKNSDIDILVEIERPIGLKFFELWEELEKLLKNKNAFESDIEDKISSISAKKEAIYKELSKYKS